MKLTFSLAAATLLAASTAYAQSYPSEPVTLVVPYGPGGASDLAGRALAESAREYLGQPITVVNQAGAGGMTGARDVVQADPDGYTLLLARVGMALSPAVNENSSVDWDEYTFISPLEATPMILAVADDSPYESVEDLLKGIENDPGAMSYAASGATAIDGFTVQSLLADAEMDPLTAATLIPYRGGGELATALLGGHVDFLAIAAASLMPHIESGDMRPLMVFSPERMEALPDVPTAEELGYELAGQVIGWSALYGPPDLPEEVVNTWADVMEQVAGDETWLSRADDRGSISTIGSVDMETYAKEQYEFYRTLAEQFGYLE
ncbi:Bug family tripartite tricarboxylate transporter substrate binding protein [Vreelandella boliviensis]|uniref:Bug family tripartite tricarboxylate transporter substrate binding protein n=1 Tax=Vreelandella boliviensis TaxID=223527 RepID=UPI001B8CA641|nr:tripartite tricarboxylate transporter substrate binding protein [Halomonas boliviensis]MBS3668134.1 tripartite tricarboxylate transporter substrate binding protein [Halomonas boliviensis]